MDIVIPYHTDPHNGMELLYALRSIDKYLTGYGEVFIIGDKPKWLRNVTHIPTDSTDRAMSNRKEYNIMRKILRATNDDRVSEGFIVWHDDHFLLRTLDVLQIQNWHNGLMEDVYKKAHSGYKQTMGNTIEYNMGSGMNYDIHAPMLMNKGLFKSYVASAPWHQKEFCIKSLYAHTMPGEYMEDCKINSPLSADKIYDKIAGRLLFSTGPYAMHEGLVKVFEELYPERSKFEA